jgi:hypothetical protein
MTHVISGVTVELGFTRNGCKIGRGQTMLGGGAIELSRPLIHYLW